ncbi:hypothetical protein [Chryseolinea sp. H1M3-3]|uniref:hypothetical protein n=1 Tax=Chryseolinea sp. H1M3-3 TaxID=3034144 RepID=UPI0023EB79B2|nr:hypothetical protein [Chryseolinea sp. H1M3-3]
MKKSTLAILHLLFFATVLSLPSCSDKEADLADEAAQLDALAGQYVRLGLAIGQYDKDFVDAYYGPDSLKPTNPASIVFPKDSFLTEINSLATTLNSLHAHDNDTIANRATWMSAQLKAFERRVKLFGGDSASFEVECKELYGVTPPVYDSSHFQKIVHTLDDILPGKGAVNERFKKLANRFVIPPTKLDTVIQAAIAESRRRTQQYLELPDSENFNLEFVTDKPWGGYNWYKGNYKSLIQVNTDLDILIDDVIDVASHESYPGHHVYNMLLEKNLYHDNGWVEISLYPLFSPQSFIAEGSANYGIALAFPGEEKVRFAREVLLPLASVDTTGIERYFTALELTEQLNYVMNEVTRGLLNGTMNEAQGIYWLKNFYLMDDDKAKKSMSFIRKNRSYVINYNYGKDLVKAYVEGKAGTSINKQWEAFGWLLSKPVLAATLEEK